MSKRYYKYKLSASEDGVTYYLSTYKSFYETPCYHYCIPEYSMSASDPFIKDGETILQSIKRRGVKFKKIHKTQSRIAFDTKEQAYDNCIYLKKLQLEHLKRSIKLINLALSEHDSSGFSGLIDHGYTLVAESTAEKINEMYTFL